MKTLLALLLLAGLSGCKSVFEFDTDPNPRFVMSTATIRLEYSLVTINLFRKQQMELKP